jgi:hypothetical protein
MRVVVYSPPKYRSLVDGAVGIPAEVHEDWAAFERAVHGADCAVAVIESLTDTPGAAELNALRVAHPWTGFVLVTPLDGENALLAPAAADSIVWLHFARAYLNEAILSAASGLRTRLARHVSRESKLSPRGKRAVIALLEADPPPRRVSEWVRLVSVSCAPSTLWRQFRQESVSTPLQPHILLNVVHLLWALDRFPHVLSWAALAAVADVDQDTLKQTARWLAGVNLAKPNDLQRADLLRATAQLLI